MLHKCKLEITIRKVDNGYIVEWTNGKYASDDEDSGVRIFTTFAQVHQFLKGKL